MGKKKAPAPAPVQVIMPPAPPEAKPAPPKKIKSKKGAPMKVVRDGTGASKTVINPDVNKDAGGVATGAALKIADATVKSGLGQLAGTKNLSDQSGKVTGGSGGPQLKELEIGKSGNPGKTKLNEFIKKNQSHGIK